MYDLSISNYVLSGQEALHYFLGSLNQLMLAAFPGLITGTSYDGTYILVHFFAPFSPTDEATAQGIVDAFELVTISAIRADDTVTVTLRKLNNVDSATELTLTIDGTPAPTASPLVDNVAVVDVTSEDPIVIGIADAYLHTEVVT